jgi:hypothetical protein
MSTEVEKVHTGIVFPRETLKKLDKYRGYYSRNRYMLKIVDDFLARQEAEMKSMISRASGERRGEK